MLIIFYLLNFLIKIFILQFLHKLGVPKDWCIVDVYGLEPDLLALVPKPVLAVILLYPLSKKVKKL